jgi:anaerobic selenocysteine-containing dehydrogenase
MRYDAASDHHVPVSWDDAFKLIAQHLNKIAGEPHIRRSSIPRRASNEAAYLYQLFVRAWRNNFPDSSNMCHEASGVALGQSVGVGKGSNPPTLNTA